MRKILSLGIAIFLLTLLSACSNGGTKGNGEVVSTTPAVGCVFDKLVIKGAMNVLVTTNKTPKVTITTDSNLQQYIKTSIEGDTLTIQLQDGAHISPSQTIAVSVRTKALKSIVTKGANKINVTNLMAQNFRVDSDGANTINLRGTVENLTVDASGSTKVNAAALKANNVTTTIEGSGNVKVDASDNLNIHIQGSGIIQYAGNPEITQEVMGSGKIIKVKK